jgi:hypothetical protein
MSPRTGRPCHLSPGSCPIRTPLRYRGEFEPDFSSLPRSGDVSWNELHLNHPATRRYDIFNSISQSEIASAQKRWFWRLSAVVRRLPVSANRWQGAETTPPWRRCPQGVRSHALGAPRKPVLARRVSCWFTPMQVRPPVWFPAVRSMPHSCGSGFSSQSSRVYLLVSRSLAQPHTTDNNHEGPCAKLCSAATPNNCPETAATPSRLIPRPICSPAAPVRLYIKYGAGYV